jgi:hypothetical protein
MAAIFCTRLLHRKNRYFSEAWFWYEFLDFCKRKASSADSSTVPGRFAARR